MRTPTKGPRTAIRDAEVGQQAKTFEELRTSNCQHPTALLLDHPTTTNRFWPQRQQLPKPIISALLSQKRPLAPQEGS